MQKRRVNLSIEVSEYLSDLAIILLKKGYFSFIENAIKFTDYLHDTIVNEIDTLKHNPVTDENKQYGTHYIVIRMHKRFSYHAYFVIKNEEYYITKISSNKLPDAEFLNRF